MPWSPASLAVLGALSLGTALGGFFVGRLTSESVPTDAPTAALTRAELHEVEQRLAARLGRQQRDLLFALGSCNRPSAVALPEPTAAPPASVEPAVATTADDTATLQEAYDLLDGATRRQRWTEGDRIALRAVFHRMNHDQRQQVVDDLVRRSNRDELELEVQPPF